MQNKDKWHWIDTSNSAHEAEPNIYKITFGLMDETNLISSFIPYFAIDLMDNKKLLAEYILPLFFKNVTKVKCWIFKVSAVFIKLGWYAFVLSRLVNMLNCLSISNQIKIKCMTFAITQKNEFKTQS